MEEKLVVRLSNNLGNQMFMYAAGYAASKYLNRNFYYDKISSYKSNKNIYTYALDEFKIEDSEAIPNDTFLGLGGYLKRKILKKIDIFKKRKSFILEKYDINKGTFYCNLLDIHSYNNTAFMEGYFESEKYFVNFKDEIRNQFTPKSIKIYKKNKFYNKILNENSIALCIRQNRFTEKLRDISDKDRNKSKIFLEEQILFVSNAIEHFKKKIKSPSFYLWSNNFENLRHIFKNQNITFVDNSDISNSVKKMHLDLYLMTKCNHFAVIPSAFNWWGAWLSNSGNKLILRPKTNYFKYLEIKNKDYWPDEWISL